MTDNLEFAEPCPCCGSITGTTLALDQAPTLLAVCDVLVIKALEVIGKRIVRSERARFKMMRGRPWHEAHTQWNPDESMITKSMAGAWDVVPAMIDSHGSCGIESDQIIKALDDYVRDLLITGTPHRLTELKYRFSEYLGISVAT